jgi:uncharacterized protein YqeY
MTISQNVEAQLKAAMLARDPLRTSVLRMLKSAFKYAAIEQGGAEATLDDAAATAVIRKQAKQREDSIAGFEKGGRPDLADKERLELVLLADFLPKGLSADEIAEIVRGAIAEAGAISKAQMGAVMKLATAKAGGRADGRALSAEVQRQLS